ncbi:hypothetical protein ACV229_23900 [Burkholderia sp. MR1-5-21]
MTESDVLLMSRSDALVAPRMTSWINRRISLLTQCKGMGCQAGAEVLAMATPTVNAGEHPVMKHMPKPGDENRSIVNPQPSDCDEWLHAKNVDAARAMLQRYPADEMAATVVEPNVPARPK